jgi:hypothetical protein
VGIGLAFLLHALDDRIQDDADAARTLGWRTLASIPREDAGDGPQSRAVALPWNDLVPRRWRKTPVV